MKLQFCTAALLVLGVSSGGAQVPAHSPTPVKAEVSAKAASLPPAPVPKPVSRVNGAVLTELDLAREMLALFPYARVHNGFPKSLEPEIRKGALEMIIFEELLYQDAKRRHITIPPERVARAQKDLRKQYPSEAEYRQFLMTETNGSTATLREKIRRSLLIEKMLKTEVAAKSTVTPAEARAFYNKNVKQYEHGEIFHIQSISIMPPDEAPDNLKEARRRADEAIKAAKAAKSYRDFGLLAEKISDDDFHVNMGDHKPVGGEKLPPQVAKAARAMKPGDVSDLIQLGNNYTIFRLVKYTPAGRTPFSEVEQKLIADMRKEKTEKVRSALGDKLRKNAQIERL
jgi:parvulin-like peptidyl-prolyl isomerase